MVNLRSKNILNANDIKSEKLFIKEWDVEVEVKGMTGKERAAILKSAMDEKGGMDFEKMYPDLIIATTHDPETGEKVFQKEDRDTLNTKNSKCLEEIAKVAMRLSGLDKGSENEIVKN